MFHSRKSEGAAGQMTVTALYLTELNEIAVLRYQKQNYSANTFQKNPIGTLQILNVLLVQFFRIEFFLQYVLDSDFTELHSSLNKFHSR